MHYKGQEVHVEHHQSIIATATYSQCRLQQPLQLTDDLAQKHHVSYKLSFRCAAVGMHQESMRRWGLNTLDLDPASSCEIGLKADLPDSISTQVLQIL